MIEKRHEIIAEVLEEIEHPTDYDGVRELLIKTLCLASECAGYIDALRGKNNKQEISLLLR